jgi:hypothetical protein
MVELVAYRSYQERSSHEGAACRKGETSIDPLQYRRTPGSLSPCDTTRLWNSPFKEGERRHSTPEVS